VSRLGRGPPEAEEDQPCPLCTVPMVAARCAGGASVAPQGTITWGTTVAKPITGWMPTRSPREDALLATQSDAVTISSRVTISEGTNQTWQMDHNQRWMEEVRPIVEAFLHTRYFLDMAVR
jgi:hypothetical protein